MKNIYFTPGPSGLYFTVSHHLKEAVKNGIASISHRSKQFEAIYQEAEENLSELLGVPEEYKLLFTSSATEIWERLADSVIPEKSLHLVNGAFSYKFYSVVKNLGKKADILEAEWGHFPTTEDYPGGGYDLVGVTHNETSTGVKTPLDTVYKLKDDFPGALLAIDCVSSLPVVDFDYTRVDTIYASVQKAFGLPAGLGVWLINQATEDKVRQLHKLGKVRNSSNSLINLLNNHKKYQTPFTPNILNIYLLAKVTRDMIMRGIGQIRNDSIYKSAILYNLLDTHPSLDAFVENKQLRSDTIVVIDSGNATERLIDYLSAHKMIVGSGYGKMKGKQVRIANFPTHSKEQFEMLVDLIDKFE